MYLELLKHNKLKIVMFNYNVKKKMKFVYYFQQKKIKMELLINF